MSHSHSTMSDPVPGEPVPLGTLVYMRERNKQRVYELVTNEFEQSEISVKELAARTGRDTSRVSKFLGEVGNWTIDTISDYVFAMKGGSLEYRISYPLKAALTNDPGAAWIRHPPIKLQLTPIAAPASAKTVVRSLESVGATKEIKFEVMAR